MHLFGATEGFYCMQFNHLGIQDRNLNVCLLKLKQTHRKRVIVVIIEPLPISSEVGKRQLLFTHNRAFSQHIMAAILILCFNGQLACGAGVYKQRIQDAV